MSDKVATKNGATHTLVYIAVRGHGDITDMCRYDNCCPADEGQSMKIARGAEPGSDDAWVILKRFVPAGMPKAPTSERWKSFGWEVVSGGPGWYPSLLSAEDAVTRHEANKVSEAARRLGA